VGHMLIFLVLAGGGDGFRRSAITGVVFVYNTHWDRGGFLDDGLFDVFVVYLFVVVLLVLFFFFFILYSLSVSMGFHILLVCFRACFARISLLIFKNGA
jgi:hypothetical protein